MKNISLIDKILILFIIDIIVFVNYYSMGQKLFELMFFLPIYTSLMMFFYKIKGCKQDLLRRSLLTALTFYFTFVLIVKIIAVYSMDWYHIIYTKKYINYSVAIGFIVSLLIKPIINKWGKK